MDRPVRRMYIVEKRRIGYNRFQKTKECEPGRRSHAEQNEI